MTTENIINRTVKENVADMASNLAGGFLVALFLVLPLAFVMAGVSSGVTNYLVSGEIENRRNERLKELARVEEGDRKLQLFAFEESVQSCENEIVVTIFHRDYFHSWHSMPWSVDARAAAKSAERRCASNVVMQVALENPSQASALAFSIKDIGYELVQQWQEAARSEPGELAEAASQF